MPDNTAHIVLERLAGDLPIPGLHIADVVATSSASMDGNTLGYWHALDHLTGPVYENALKRHGMERLIPDEAMREQLNTAIL